MLLTECCKELGLFFPSGFQASDADITIISIYYSIEKIRRVVAVVVNERYKSNTMKIPGHIKDYLVPEDEIYPNLPSDG